MKSFLFEQLQKYVMLFDITTDQLMAWVGDWKERVPELYNPNFQIFSVYAFWGAGIYLLWANKKQTLNVEEKDRLEELERIFVRAETKAEIATHLFPEKVINELDAFFSKVAKWWQGEYNRKLDQLKTEDKKSELKLAVAYILYRREQMWFATLAMERQCLRGTTKLVANLKSMSEFLVGPAIKSLCQEYQNLFKGNTSDPWFPEEFWWRKTCPFQEDCLSDRVTIFPEKKSDIELKAKENNEVPDIEESPHKYIKDIKEKEEKETKSTGVELPNGHLQTPNAINPNFGYSSSIVKSKATQKIYWRETVRWNTVKFSWFLMSFNLCWIFFCWIGTLISPESIPPIDVVEWKLLTITTIIAVMIMVTVSKRSDWKCK